MQQVTALQAPAAPLCQAVLLLYQQALLQLLPNEQQVCQPVPHSTLPLMQTDLLCSCRLVSCMLCWGTCCRCRCWGHTVLGCCCRCCLERTQECSSLLLPLGRSHRCSARSSSLLLLHGQLPGSFRSHTAQHCSAAPACSIRQLPLRQTGRARHGSCWPDGQQLPLWQKCPAGRIYCSTQLLKKQAG